MVLSCSSRATPHARPGNREPAATTILLLALLLSSNAGQRTVQASRGGRLLQGSDSPSSSQQQALTTGILPAPPYKSLRRLQQDATGSAGPPLMAVNPLFHWRPRAHLGGSTRYHEPLLHELEDDPSSHTVALSARVRAGACMSEEV